MVHACATRFDVTGNLKNFLLFKVKYFNLFFFFCGSRYRTWSAARAEAHKGRGEFEACIKRVWMVYYSLILIETKSCVCLSRYIMVETLSESNFFMDQA